MKKNIETLIFKFPSKNEWIALFIFTITLPFLYYKIAQDISIDRHYILDLRLENLKKMGADLLVVLITFYTSRYWLWLIEGKLIVKISPNELIIIKYYSLIPIKKTFQLSKIKKINIQYNVRDGTWEGKGVFITYNTDKSIIFFNYEKKEYRIGTKVLNFEAEQIKNDLQKRCIS